MTEKNNYALCCGQHDPGNVSIYRQVPGIHPPQWVKLATVPRFPAAKDLLAKIDPDAKPCGELRQHYSDASRRWALFYRNYAGPAIIDGRELEPLYQIEDLMQMEPVAA